MVEVPIDVVEYLRGVFSACNRQITQKLSNSPNAPEESLDLSWIEHVSHHATPIVLSSDWAVKIETHYLGGMRHFHRWEIADIGVLVHFRLAGDARRSKVALLQSKRLYPIGAPIRDETLVDYELGFGRLADPEDQSISITLATEYRFRADSAYQQIRRGSHQVDAIDAYQREVGLHVYYQLYNPWVVPFVQRVPLTTYTEGAGEPEIGVRVVPAATIHGVLANGATNVPTMADLATIAPVPAQGWRLEDFICDELIACHEGDIFTSLSDQRMQRLFNRRSGAIAAAIAITIEEPSGAVA